jgi:hypothetical protein
MRHDTQRMKLGSTRCESRGSLAADGPMMLFLPHTWRTFELTTCILATCAQRMHAAQASIQANKGFLILTGVPACSVRACFFDSRHPDAHTGVCLRADTVSTNGRLYPKELLEREVKRFKEQACASMCAHSLMQCSAPARPEFSQHNTGYARPRACAPLLRIAAALTHACSARSACC